MNFPPQKSLHIRHEASVCHILEQSIILYMSMKFHLLVQLVCVRIVLIRRYSYGNTPVKDQKSEFISEYKQKFIHSIRLREALQIDGQ